MRLIIRISARRLHASRRVRVLACCGTAALLLAAAALAAPA